MSPVLKVENLKVYFPRRAPLLHPGTPRIKAVDDVSFEIESNAVVGLIGETGCGKTALTHAIARLHHATSGHAFYQEKDILRMSSSAFRPLRREIQLLFQDCRSSLNPHQPIESTLVQSLSAVETKFTPDQLRTAVREILERLELPAKTGKLYPRDLPPGHAERVALARALSIGARLLIIDDSLAALDLRLQREFLDLLLRLKEELRLTCLFACHDFGLLMLIAGDALVMSRGKIVEAAPISSIVDHPKHDFTKKLLASTVTVN